MEDDSVIVDDVEENNELNENVEEEEHVIEEELIDVENKSFLEGVGQAIKFCRTCHLPTMRTEKLNAKFVLWGIKTHLIQLKLINDSPDLSKQYGVKNTSVLQKINCFDICTCLLHDPMHVLIEGVCITELKN